MIWTSLISSNMLRRLSIFSASLCISIYLEWNWVGLHTLQNDCYCYEFLEVVHAHKHLNAYIDHNNETLFEWIEKEEPDSEKP